MKTRLNKYTCDRCGKIRFFDSFDQLDNNNFPEAAFVFGNYQNTVIAKGHVCPECLNDFKTLAENFFDEVNKDEQREAD